MNFNDNHTCQICNKKKNFRELIPSNNVRDSVVKTIKKEYPNWSPNGYICLEDLNHFRKEHIRDILEAEKGDLSDLDEEVVKSLKQEELISKNINKDFDTDSTIGQKIADKVAEFGGSWTFIISFGLFILMWIIINTIVLLKKSFDPYPFILLNLLLSCLASLQAPVIMMSQNRQEAKDRLRAEHDYQINLKAEVEIRHLNEKLDYLITEWLKLMEIQEMQTEMLHEVTIKNNTASNT